MQPVAGQIIIIGYHVGFNFKLCCLKIMFYWLHTKSGFYANNKEKLNGQLI